jgi:long-chain acyl-CoA synthetase
MTDQITLTIPAILKRSAEKYRERPAMAFAGENPITFGELARKVESLVSFLEKQKVGKGDRVAILAANSPYWGMAYLAITSLGAVAVPLLPDFHADEIANILEHSEAKMVFVSEGLKVKIPAGSRHLDTVITIEDFSVISGRQNNITYQPGERPSGRYEVLPDDLASIIYTSGTTGTSKGVMLSHRNICFTAVGGSKVQEIGPDDRMLSILPLSHTYENTLGFILPLMQGCSIHYLRKPPTAPVLLPALKRVRPTMMLSVPMIIEKIYRKKVLPGFEKKKVISSLYKVPFFRRLLNRVAGRKLIKTFGGELRFFGVGGAKLDPVVEKFLIEAKFPYAIGYGLTETAPLLAGVNPKTVRLESTGPAMEGVTLKINDPDPVTGEGEIWAKGDNVMMGYFKAPELTAEVMHEGGWFKTGDLGVFDKDNFLYIKGRLKSMIVGASGENIHPEEIEAVINNFEYVSESLVVQQAGKLTALVHFNREELEARYQHLKDELSSFIEKHIEELQEEIKNKVNARVNKFSRLQAVRAQQQPFQKTATQKIKRFLYQQ